MKIKKAVIPVAGLGTRFLPITKSVPKEMLPIVDKPCVQYLVEEAVLSGINEIVFVVNDDKPAIKEYFSSLPRLENKLKKANKPDELKLVQNLSKMAKFHYVNQPQPKGDGHAVLCAEKLIKNEPFAVIFGDDIYESNPPALLQLIKVFEQKQSPVIALEKIDKKDSKKYGIIDPLEQKGLVHQIKNLVEKPTPEKAPSNLAITGKYIITPELLKDLKKSKSSTKDGELRLIDGMRTFISKKPIFGLEIKGKRFDTGDKFGYLRAVLHFSLKNKNLSAQVKKYLRELDL